MQTLASGFFGGRDKHVSRTVSGQSHSNGLSAGRAGQGQVEWLRGLGLVVAVGLSDRPGVDPGADPPLYTRPHRLPTE